LLPGLRWDALHACLRDASLVPHPSILLLALHLLADAAWPASPRRPYARLLPAPAGSALAAVCDAGPAGTDVVLFADSELDGLACAPLARAVRVERGRLQRLRKELLAAGPGPDISFASFAWAHALVRSRALDLSVVAGGEADADAATAPSLRVMLPLLDLAQHATGPSACVLRLVRSPAGEPAAVDLISRAGLAVGAPVCLDYGARPLRDLLRGYAFVPAAGDVVAGGHSEVFEDADADGAVALVVDAGRRERGGGDSGSCMLALDHVRVFAAPGGDTKLTPGPILSTLNAGTTSPGADTYVGYQGTSMATPHVAGVAALVKSVNPSLTPTALLSVLQNTSAAFPAGSTCSTANCGRGMLDASAAVSSGFAEKMRPSTPATNGVAEDVPPNS
jgi:hypothetical protein